MPEITPTRTRAVDPSVFRSIKNPLQRLLLIELAGFADRHGRAWPSHDALADCLACCVKTVRNAIRALEALGELRVWRRKKRRNLYYITRICRPTDHRGAHKRISPYRDIQKSEEVGGASRPPDDFPSLAPDAASARCSRGSGEQAEPPNPLRSSEKTVLPDGWQPPMEDLSYALDHTGQDVKWCCREATKFVEHFRDTGRVSACWELEWRRWISRGLAYREKRLASRRWRRIKLAA